MGEESYFISGFFRVPNRKSDFVWEIVTYASGSTCTRERRKVFWEEEKSSMLMAWSGLSAVFGEKNSCCELLRDTVLQEEWGLCGSWWGYDQAPRYQDGRPFISTQIAQPAHTAEKVLLHPPYFRVVQSINYEQECQPEWYEGTLYNHRSEISMGACGNDACISTC